MKGWKLSAGALIVIVAMAVAVLVIPMELEILALQKTASEEVLLIDPGHGGIDSGAVGSGGTSEKHINLSIGLFIKEMAEIDGWKVIMTRIDDRELSPGEGKQSIRGFKTADILGRKEIIEKAKPKLAVSIHLNSFKQDRGVRGAQTFYPAIGEAEIVKESKALAEIVQQSLVEGIDDGTNRVALSKSDVLLLKNPLVPIVIVECGFLSNPDEEVLLRREDYQREIAKHIYRGIMKYSGKEGKPPIKVIDNRA